MQNIILLGLVSFFSDISAEMVYPLIPLYLTTVFGATPVLVGIVEGIAESIASLLKVYSGYISDKYKRKKALAFGGYSTGIIYKVALLLATSWTGILLARVIDRIGKGIRTTPRDVLVCESADKDKMGKAFGIHKALDMAGAAMGILIAYLLLSNSNSGFDYQTLFMLSIIPAILGLTDANVILLYFVYNISAALFSIPFGHLSDKFGRKKILVLGYLMFAAVYGGFAVVTNSEVLVLLFLAYGLYTAMTAGVERALISEIAPADLKGTMLGLQSTIVGIALLPASVIAGLLWNTLGETAPFIFGAGLAFLSACMLIFLMNLNSTKAEKY